MVYGSNAANGLSFSRSRKVTVSCPFLPFSPVPCLTTGRRCSVWYVRLSLLVTANRRGPVKASFQTLSHHHQITHITQQEGNKKKDPPP
eukprot:scaffold1508_cov178-Amphora_coffeaeformis.AAC.4